MFKHNDIWWVWTESSHCTICNKLIYYGPWPAAFRPGHWVPTDEYKSIIVDEKIWRQLLWWL